MIIVNEFRLGNSLLVADKMQSLCSISLIDIEDSIYDVGYISDNSICYLRSDSKYLQPVPLTDELLISCGFKFDTYFKLWQRMKKVYGTGLDMEITNDYTVLDFSHRPISKEIKHLHHLQNLFYALKRKELEVNLSIQQVVLTEEPDINSHPS